MATRILVVDDNPVIADTLKTILNSAGYDCITAYSPNDAINIVAEYRPNLVITDMVMPGMNGAQFASTLHRLQPSLPIILMSGDPQAEELQIHAKESGGRVTVLGKPFVPRDLLLLISQMTTADESAA